MTRRLGVAVVGAVVAAAFAGGTGFAAGGGTNGSSGPSGPNSTSTFTHTNTNTQVNIQTDPNAGTRDPNTQHAVHCANLQAAIVTAQLKVAGATNARQAQALAKQVTRLQQQWQQQCA